MDKMTHAKFNFNNFLLAISSGIDNAIEKNKNNIQYSSLRVVYIALKIASFNDFSKQDLSDIMSFIILSKHDIDTETLKQFPFINFAIFENNTLQNILHLCDAVENNIEINNNFVVNKSEIISLIEALVCDEVIQENFLYLAENESFWLDVASLQRLPFFILDMLEDTTLEIEYEKLLLIGKTIEQIVYKYANRTSKYSISKLLTAMATLYNFDNKDSSRFILSGYLHLIGLLKIPKGTIIKKDLLTPLEYDTIKSVPYYSKEILSMIFGFDDITKLVATYYEKLDGSGYPYHVEGNELSLKERVCGILCIYQAMSEERPYREALSQNEIFKILEEEGKGGRLDISVIKDLKTISQ
jgi:HD-GYP domain-containing protein (c-di-GMP phosphodiesterase class II)